MQTIEKTRENKGAWSRQQIVHGTSSQDGSWVMPLTDHELYVLKYSRVKLEGICPAAKVCPKLGHATHVPKHISKSFSLQYFYWYILCHSTMSEIQQI